MGQLNIFRERRELIFCNIKWYIFPSTHTWQKRNMDAVSHCSNKGGGLYPKKAYPIGGKPLRSVEKNLNTKIVPDILKTKSGGNGPII